MIGATLYIVVCTGRNRLRMRLRRLREPRYLIGAAVGAVYLAFSLGLRQRAFRSRPTTGSRAGAEASAAAVNSAFTVLGPTLGGVALAALACLCWLLPFDSNLLAFSSAETAMLFSAPVSRRQLVVYRLLRSQATVFTGALIMALAYPSGSWQGRIQGLFGVWLLLMTGHAFFTVVSLAKSHVKAGKGLPAFAWPAIALPLAAAGGIAVPLLTRTGAAAGDLAGAIDAVIGLARHSPTHFFLLPFSALASPFFAGAPSSVFPAIAGALGTYLATFAWLVWADSRSTDAADASVERQEGVKRSRTRSTYRYRDVGWQLAPVGAPEMVFVWKGALRTFRAIDRASLVRGLSLLTALLCVTLFATRARGLVVLLGVCATWAALFTTLMAPQLIRMDLREDLANLEWLKAWPVRSVAVLRGEILWPAAMVTAVAWFFGVAALLLSLTSSSRIPLASRSAVWFAFLVLVPGVVLAQYTIHNAIAVLFPGWIPLGTSRPRGLDAAGQRLILLAASWFAMIVALIPGAVVTVMVAWAVRPNAGAWVFSVGGIVTTLAVVGEMVLVTRALAPVYDSLDITSTERPDA